MGGRRMWGEGEKHKDLFGQCHKRPNICMLVRRKKFKKSVVCLRVIYALKNKIKGIETITLPVFSAPFTVT